MNKVISTLLFCSILFVCSWGQGRARQPEKLPVDTSFLLPVNGVNQYLEIKGVSRRKPVLLFIHGGPSWPATPMNRKYNEDLTKILSW